MGRLKKYRWGLLSDGWHLQWRFEEKDLMIRLRLPSYQVSMSYCTFAVSKVCVSPKNHVSVPY